MPNRIIRDSCKTSPTLDKLSHGAERFFWRLTTVADDFGRFNADPRVLLASCFPLKVGVLKIGQLESWFQEMIQCDLVRAYDANGHRLGFFTTWTKHQQLRAKTSRFPEPPLLADASICSQVQADSFGNGNDLRSGNDQDPETISSSPRLKKRAADGFSDFWSAYPRKVGKGAAEKAWAKLNGTDPKIILEAIDAQKQSPSHLQREIQFIPHPATWLNQKRWLDEVKPYDPGDFPT